MNIWLSPYELKLIKGGSRRGYLLKTQNENEEPGYSDIFPWPEFGDPEFHEIPSMILKGQKDPLIRQSLFFSRRDAMERSEGLSLTQGIHFKNHYLVTGECNTWFEEVEMALNTGFQSIKFKVGREHKTEIRTLIEIFKNFPKENWIRLDFNGKGSVDFFKEIEAYKNQIQFVEDPFAEPSLWGDLSWPLAYDQPPFESKEVNHLVRVIKPAKQEAIKEESQTHVFTSYLDHPVGIAHALVEANFFGDQDLDYGLMSQNYYEPTPFHEYLISKGPQLSIQDGKGIGFDELWNTLTWMPLC